MKPYPLLALILLSCSGSAFSDERSFRSALIELPPKYLGDIPLADRAVFMKELSTDARRMDVAGNWLHWFSDGGDVRGTSMIWAKELPRADKSALILIHMAKPFATGGKPEANQTFVMENIGKDWMDVTKKVMPAGVDMKHHFRTRKNDTTIEVAQWEQFDRADGRGKAWKFGPRVMDLHWEGQVFVIKKPKSATLTKN